MEQKNKMESLASLSVKCIRNVVTLPLHIIVKKLIKNGYIPSPIGDLILQKKLLFNLAGGPFCIETFGKGTVIVDGINRLFSKKDF